MINKLGDTLTSAKAIADKMKGTSLRIRYDAVLGVRRELKRHKDMLPRVRSIRSDFMPTSRTISTTKVNLLTQYRIRGTALVRNRMSGAIEDRNIVFGSDTLETMGQSRDRAREIIRDAQETSSLSPREGSPQFDIISVNVDLIEQRSL